MNRYEKSDKMVIAFMAWLVFFATIGFFSWIWMMIWVFKNLIS